MTKTTAPAEPADLVNQIELCRKAIASLEARPAAIQVQRVAASKLGNAERLIELEHEADEVPTRLRALRIRLLTLQIEKAEADIPPAQADLTEAADAVAVADAAVTEAYAAQKIAAGLYFGALEKARDIPRRTSDLRRERDQLLAEANRPVAPIVRSIPHSAA